MTATDSGTTEPIDYDEWRAQVATDLERLRGISAGIIPERVWIRLPAPRSTAGAGLPANFARETPISEKVNWVWKRTARP
jgi:hypothetical protein